MVKSLHEYRKAEIVQAASKVLIDSGLTHLSYDYIAVEAGTSRQLIRHYYPDPEQLMVELCQGLSAWYEGTIEIEFSGLDGVDRLNQLLDFYFDLNLSGKPNKRKDDLVIDALVALSASSEVIKTNLFEHYANLKDQLARSIKVAHPSIKPKQCDYLGFQISCLIYGHWKMVASLGFDSSQNILSRSAVNRLIDSHL